MTVQELANLIARTFPEREYSGPIGPQTELFGEMGFASIDAVVLGEAIEQHIGRKVPFAALLADVRDRGATDLELGELAQFLNGPHHAAR
ncbi:MAG: phosphopantetheine-binding protein [Gemmataceae bacterium]